MVNRMDDYTPVYLTGGSPAIRELAWKANPRIE
jgi:hypothetical protein